MPADRPSPILAIVDYGMGNIGSVCHALDVLGGRYVVSSRAADFAAATAIVLPGVGAFGAAMDNLRARGLIDPLTAFVMEERKPFLGICLGMQLLARDSVENGFSEGLGWIDGHVRAMQPPAPLRVPHVGWNGVLASSASPLFARVDADAHFYFDHSFHLECSADLVVASADYGGAYVAGIEKDNLFAVQFHPEKSQRNGLRLLRNFLNVVQDRTAERREC